MWELKLKLKFYYVGRVVKGLAVPQKNLINFYLFLQLAAICDVFVENYVPGKLSEMGLGYEDIDKIAPHIIYCSITGISTLNCPSIRNPSLLPKPQRLLNRIIKDLWPKLNSFIDLLDICVSFLNWQIYIYT